MLTNNEGYNHAIQRQGFTENQHNEHTDKELVLIVGLSSEKEGVRNRYQRLKNIIKSTSTTNLHH